MSIPRSTSDGENTFVLFKIVFEKMFLQVTINEIVTGYYMFMHNYRVQVNFFFLNWNAILLVTLKLN